MKINLFDDREELSLVDKLFDTEIFSLLFVIIFTGLSVQTQTITIQSPSIDKFIEFSSRYSSRFSCPCKQSSIRQNEFVQYHPICKSQFVNQIFL